MSLPLGFLTVVAEAAPANPVSLHPWTFIFQVINVIVVIGGLSFLLFRPIGDLMKKREAFVEESLTNAQKASREADALRAEYQKKLGSVDEEAQRILRQAAREAREYEQAKKDEADAKYEQIIAKAREEIEESKKTMLASLQEDMVTMAVMAASQVLGRVISDGEHRQILRDFIEKVMVLPQVVEELTNDVHDSRDSLRVELTTAVPLPEELCLSLRQRLARLGGDKEVRLAVREDPDLIGGARLRINGVFIDDSISSRLRQLERFLTENGSQDSHK
ncbi:MAG: F0F1 ATP synthase subunit B [Limnochordia bacterium]